MSPMRSLGFTACEPGASSGGRSCSVTKTASPDAQQWGVRFCVPLLLGFPFFAQMGDKESGNFSKFFP